MNYFIYIFGFILHLAFAASAIANGGIATMNFFQMEKSSDKFKNVKFGRVYIDDGKVKDSTENPGGYYQYTLLNKHFMLRDSYSGKNISLLGKQNSDCKVTFDSRGNLEVEDKCKGMIFDSRKKYLKPNYVSDFFLYPALKEKENIPNYKIAEHETKKLLKYFTNNCQALSNKGAIIAHNAMHAGYSPIKKPKYVESKFACNNPTISKIGQKGLIKIFFVTSDELALVLTVSNEEISVLRFDYGYRIELSVFNDIDDDGLPDVYLFRSQCCEYFLLHDGEKWIMLAESGPA